MSSFTFASNSVARRRKVTNTVMTVLVTLAFLIALLPLIFDVFFRESERDGDVIGRVGFPLAQYFPNLNPRGRGIVAMGMSTQNRILEGIGGRVSPSNDFDTSSDVAKKLSVKVGCCRFTNSPE